MSGWLAEHPGIVLVGAGFTGGLVCCVLRALYRELRQELRDLAYRTNLTAHRQAVWCWRQQMTREGGVRVEHPAFAGENAPRVGGRR